MTADHINAAVEDVVKIYAEVRKAEYRVAAEHEMDVRRAVMTELQSRRLKDALDRIAREL